MAEWVLPPGEGAGVVKLGSREEGEGARTDKEKSTTLCLTRPSARRQSEGGPRHQTGLWVLIRGSDESCGAVGARPAAPGRFRRRLLSTGGGSFGISFRATRGTARPRTAATRLPRTGRAGNLSRPGVSLPPGFGCARSDAAMARGALCAPSQRKGDGARSRGWGGDQRGAGVQVPRDWLPSRPSPCSRRSLNLTLGAQ